MKIAKAVLGMALVLSLALVAGWGCMDMSSCPVHRLLFGSKKAEAKQAPGPQTVCPIMGGKIDRKVYTDYEGKRVYFCCPGCIEKFRKDPAKYVQQLEASGAALEQVPAAKP